MENNIEYIENYYLGKLNATERAAFEHRRKTDKAFAEEVLLVKDILKVAEAVLEEDMRKHIQKMSEELETEGFWEQVEKREKKIKEGVIESTTTPTTKKATKIIPFSSRRILAIAASLTILILLGIYLFLPTSGTTLFAKHFEPSPDLINPYLDMAGYVGNPEVKGIKPPLEAYNHQNFEAASKGFEKLLRVDATKWRPYVIQLIKFHNANALLADGHPEAALELLKALSEETGHDLQSSINWYSAMAYLKMNEKEKAKPLIERLKNDEDFGEKARSLLGDW